MRFGVGDALVEQPDVQLIQALNPQAWREEPLTHKADLVLDLAFLPPRCRCACDRLDEVMTAHLLETTVVEAFLADKYRLHRRLRSAWPRTDGGHASLS